MVGSDEERYMTYQIDNKGSETAAKLDSEAIETAAAIAGGLRRGRHSLRGYVPCSRNCRTQGAKTGQKARLITAGPLLLNPAPTMKCLHPSEPAYA